MFTFKSSPRLRPLKIIFALLVTLTAALFFRDAALAQTKRVVTIKVDGLPYALLDQFVRERNQRTGKSQLPWIEHVFYQRGTRVENFYVRGMSLSGPSWSLLDTGQHLQIKGNVEYDRYTLHSYDYLNFIPFYLATVAQARVDMPGAEVLDEVGLPLLVDAYPYDERYIGFQLYQRGTRWTTLQRSLQNRFLTRGPRELVDEWTLGLEARHMIYDQLERELIEKLDNPRVRYLDYYTSEFDHAAHHNRDRESHLYALQELDAIVGRIWTAIQKSARADETALIIVSDHGVNTAGPVYSQGYNLVKLLGSRAGGGHHVITKRRLLLDYSVKGVYPLVPLITTTTPETYYLKGQSTKYQTALLDFDGNERASIHLRNSDLNVLHILLQQLGRKDLSQELRRPLTEAFLSVIERRDEEWQNRLTRLNEELGALRRSIARLRARFDAQPKNWTRADRDAGRDQDARRIYARMDSSIADERKYTEYARTLTNLLALRRENFDPSRLRIEDVIAERAMGEPNTVHDLQNYVVGIAPNGLALAAGGSLDWQKSFARVDYFALLNEIAVRNNVQPRVSNRPVDFVAARIARASLASALGKDLSPGGDAIWLYSGPQRQALILSRQDSEGGLSLRYLPIANLKQGADGDVSFERKTWGADFPLKIWEDERLSLPEESRSAWLDNWHTEAEWLRALHKTEYSNALIGLHEQLARHETEALAVDVPGLSEDERLMRRFRKRQRQLVETDLLVLASNHWNFDVRGFNPGGNHGSFFRVSTHSTLMFAGGDKTGVPRAAVVEEPYDSLSFAPTVLALTGQINGGRIPVPVLWQRGFRAFPGRVIQEVVGGAGEKLSEPPVAKGPADAP